MEITDRRGEEIDPWRKGISTMTGSTDNRLECGVKRIIAKSKCYSVAWKVSVIRSSERYSCPVGKDLSDSAFTEIPGMRRNRPRNS